MPSSPTEVLLGRDFNPFLTSSGVTASKLKVDATGVGPMGKDDSFSVAFARKLPKSPSLFRLSFFFFFFYHFRCFFFFFAKKLTHKQVRPRNAVVLISQSFIAYRSSELDITVYCHHPCTLTQHFKAFFFFFFLINCACTISHVPFHCAQP